MAQVKTSAGQLQGVSADGVAAFKGIPYAAPLDQGRRFLPPRRPEAWDGVRDASDFGQIPAQQLLAPGIYRELGAPVMPEGDDCLSLNVWTPDPGGAGLPVFVWICGGGFYSGSSDIPVYSGSSFARDGVVAVSLNYRLGFQGFCQLDEHFPQLEHTGNLGILDQIAALEWIQENIAAFGGDPARVTIAGESAGGMCVATLMAAPRARGLFQRAIAESGAAHNGISAPTASMIAGHLLQEIGVRPGDLDSLERVSPKVFTEATYKLTMELAQTRDPARFGEAAASALPLQPTYGTEILPERPIAAIEGGAAAGVALIVGTNREELLISATEMRDLFTEDLVRQTVAATFGEARTDEVLGRYRRNRPTAATHEIAFAIETDRYFRIPAVRMADAQAAHNRDTWMYQFVWRTPVRGGHFGACHFLEVPFVLDQFDNDVARGFIGDAAPDGLAAAMHGAWVAFAAHGDPGLAAIPGWARHDAGRRPTMIFGAVTRQVDDPDGDERQLWDGIL
jgi:para-nitrobenzyl esterase